MKFLTRTITGLTVAAAGAMLAAGFYAETHRTRGQP